MAKPEAQQGHIFTFPERCGGGRVMLRELPLSVERAIASRHIDDHSGALSDALVTASIVEVSPDIAMAAGVAGDLTADGLVVVDDNMPGRREVYEALGRPRRLLLNTAWTRVHTFDPGDLRPFLASETLVVR